MYQFERIDPDNPMRPSVKLGLIAAAIFAMVVASFMVKPEHGRAMTVGGGSTITLEGSPLCSGPPTAGNFLQFNSGQWCDAGFPRLYLSGFISTVNTLAAGAAVTQFQTPTAAHLVQFMAQQLVASAGCSTEAQICVEDGGNCLPNSTLTLQTAGLHNTAAISQIMTSNTIDQVEISRQDSGCGGHAQGINFVAIMSTP